MGGEVGWAVGCTHFMHSRSIPTTPGRITYGFHRPGRHRLHTRGWNKAVEVGGLGGGEGGGGVALGGYMLWRIAHVHMF